MTDTYTIEIMMIRKQVLEVEIISLEARQQAADDFSMNKAMGVESKLLECQMNCLKSIQRLKMTKMKKIPEWLKVILVLMGIPYGLFLGNIIFQILEQI